VLWDNKCGRSRNVSGNPSRLSENNIKITFVGDSGGFCDSCSHSRCSAGELRVGTGLGVFSREQVGRFGARVLKLN